MLNPPNHREGRRYHWTSFAALIALCAISNIRVYGADSVRVLIHFPGAHYRYTPRSSHNRLRYGNRRPHLNSRAQRTLSQEGAAAMLVLARQRDQSVMIARQIEVKV